MHKVSVSNKSERELYHNEYIVFIILPATRIAYPFKQENCVLFLSTITLDLTLP